MVRFFFYKIHLTTCGRFILENISEVIFDLDISFSSGIVIFNNEHIHSEFLYPETLSSVIYIFIYKTNKIVKFCLIIQKEIHNYGILLLIDNFISGDQGEMFH